MPAHISSYGPEGGATTQGLAIFVPVWKDLAHGPAVRGSSNQSGNCNARSARRDSAPDWQGLGSQSYIRRALIEADRLDCMVALPGQLFYGFESELAALAA